MSVNQDSNIDTAHREGEYDDSFGEYFGRTTAGETEVSRPPSARSVTVKTVAFPPFVASPVAARRQVRLHDQARDAETSEVGPLGVARPLPDEVIELCIIPDVENRPAAPPQDVAWPDSSKKYWFLPALAFTIAQVIFTVYVLRQTLVTDQPRPHVLFTSTGRTLAVVIILTQGVTMVIPVLLNYLLDFVSEPMKTIKEKLGDQPLHWKSKLNYGFMTTTLFLVRWQRSDFYAY